jgi:hypothetical protein
MKSPTWMCTIGICLFAALAITLQPSAQGQITAFEAPGVASSFGTSAAAINPAGAIVGFYVDASTVSQKQ